MYKLFILIVYVIMRMFAMLSVRMMFSISVVVITNLFKCITRMIMIIAINTTFFVFYFGDGIWCKF